MAGNGFPDTRAILSLPGYREIRMSKICREGLERRGVIRTIRSRSDSSPAGLPGMTVPQPASPMKGRS